MVHSLHDQAVAELALVFRHAGVGLALVDRDMRYVRVNEELAEINGISVCDHIGKTIREVVPDIADFIEAKVAAIFKTGEPLLDLKVSGETRAKPGIRRSWKANYYPNRAPSGEVIGQLLVVREDTDEQRALEALADSQSRLSMAMDGTGLGVWDWSVDSDDVWLSDTWQTMLGYTPGEVAQHISTWQASVHPDDWHAINAALDPHLAGLTPHYECEHRVRCKDGSWLWILDRGKVVKRGPDGRALRMVGTHDNIHQRKKDQLYRSALLELSRDLAELDNVNRIIDRSLLTILSMLDVDFAAYTETGEGPGYPRMARRWRDGRMDSTRGMWVGIRTYKDLARRLIHGENVAVEDLHARDFTEVVDTGHSDGEELRGLLVVPLMRQHWMVGTMIAGCTAPRVWLQCQIEFLADVRDRTREAIARARAGEAHRRAQEELQRIGRLNALSALTSTLAHELNQPLAAANNYLTVAKLQVKRVLPEEEDEVARSVEAIELAAKQVVKAGEIIRRMRAFTNSGEVMARPASVTRAVDDALETTLGSLKDRALVIRKTYAPDLPEIMLDVVQFQQVISNLVRNAIEAMEEVDQPELNLTIERSGQHVVVDVADNGPGLSGDVLANLFQPFQSDKRRGLGLGLPICRTIIEAHGGKLTGEPREGGGALFRLMLPMIKGS